MVIQLVFIADHCDIWFKYRLNIVECVFLFFKQTHSKRSGVDLAFFSFQKIGKLPKKLPANFLVQS